jgi:glycine/D-amino acid oxidase-like deaminating enzyme
MSLVLPPESRSLWDHEPHPSYDPLTERREADVVVVGAGLAGLTTAALLARSGATVLVLEGARIGAGTTGRTTAKISALQGTKYRTLEQAHNADVAGAYAAAQVAGLDLISARVAERSVDCRFERRPAATYTTAADQVATIEEEAAAATRAGLKATIDSTLDLPFAIAAAVTLPDQAQFDPTPYLYDLAAEVAGRPGCAIHEMTRVTKVGGDGKVVTDRCQVTAGTVVVTTLLPIADRGGFFARAEPKRSYSLAVRVDGPLPQTMVISTDEPTRSLRSAWLDDEQVVVLGGGGHVVGREQPTLPEYEKLAASAEDWFPGGSVVRRWSAHDYIPVDHLPMVGPLVPGRDRVLVATGFAKWGMTNATAAAMALADRVDGGDAHGSAAWRSLFDPARASLEGAKTFAQLNAGVAGRLLHDWVAPPPAQTENDLAVPSTRRQGLTPVGETHGEGEGRCAVSRVCTHLGGIVTWNDAETSWDCPLHGSRFGRCGAVLEGPAVKDLSEMPLSDGPTDGT